MVAVVRKVKGILFADYVRMMRGAKAIDWKRHLADEDLRYLIEKIDVMAWYPMATFERMGNAILKEIANDDVEAVRMWGRVSVDQLRASTPTLVAEGDPLETLMRFRVLRATFFDFDALEVLAVTSENAQIAIHYYMGPVAEKAASFQAMGFFERLLLIAGAESVEARFSRRSWEGDPRTVLELHWRTTT